MSCGLTTYPLVYKCLPKIMKITWQQTKSDNNKKRESCFESQCRTLRYSSEIPLSCTGSRHERWRLCQAQQVIRWSQDAEPLRIQLQLWLLLLWAVTWRNVQHLQHTLLGNDTSNTVILGSATTVRLSTVWQLCKGKRPKRPMNQNGPDQNGPQIFGMTKTAHGKTKTAP